MYDIEPHVAEIYDQVETQTQDVALIRRLISGRGSLRILEPFFGTGRILLPLVLDGHRVVGMDQASGMLARARSKLDCLPERARERADLLQTDVLAGAWPSGFDLVILGGNCFYELAAPEEQERCIAYAAQSLNPGGAIYVDNDHMEGELDEAWKVMESRPSFPTGVCADGVQLASTVQTVWYDSARRLARFCRRTVLSFPDGRKVERQSVQQKHPVSVSEVRTWLERHGLSVEHVYGDWAATPYDSASPRAIFWAKMPVSSPYSRRNV